MSRLDRIPDVAIDFAPPRPARSRLGPIVALSLGALLIPALALLVTQLLLR